MYVVMATNCHSKVRHIGKDLNKMFYFVPQNGRLMRELSSESIAIKHPWALALLGTGSVLRGGGGISA